MTKEVLIHLKGMQTTDDPHGSDEPLEQYPLSVV